jgi:hypothetical protein
MRLLRWLDDWLETVATFVYGPPDRAEGRAPWWCKVFVVLMWALLLSCGLAGACR